MPDIRLTKTELAALDLLIAQMEEEQSLASGSISGQFTYVLTRVTRVLAVTRLTALTRNIGGIADYPPISRMLGEEAQLGGAAQGVGAGMSLQQLMELRKQVVVEGGEQGSGGKGSGRAT